MLPRLTYLSLLCAFLFLVSTLSLVGARKNNNNNRDAQYFPQDDPSKLPNIGYIGYGYNVYYANPHATSQFDPGFGQAPIFEFTYNQQQTTPDGHWLIPDNVGVPGTATSCNVQGSSTTIKSASDYQQSLSVDAKVDLSGWGASFSASTDYKNVQNSTSSNENVYVSSSASCQTYLVDINAFVHPNLSEPFVTQGAKLPTTFDPNNASLFWQFFDLVGTHFSTQMIFGSRWGYSFQSSSSQWATIQSMGIDVDVAASYAGLINAGVSVNTSYAQQMAANFSQNTKNTFQYSLGNPPPPSGNTADWLASSLTSSLMDPLEYTLSNISVLFSSDYTTNPQLISVMDAVVAALPNYCPLYLLPSGKLSSCALPPPPPPPPPPIGYGALACKMNGASPDCYHQFANVFDGSSSTQAQEVVLDFCVGCEIQVAFDDGMCLSLAIYSGNSAWGWATAGNESTSDANALNECQTYSGGNGCTLVVSGCSTPPDPNAEWGAIACTGTCDSYFATPNGQGYPDRIEAHRIAQEQLGSGAFVVIDFDQCGAVAKGDNGFSSASGDTPQDAMNTAMAGCQAEISNCAPLTYSCTTDSFIRRPRRNDKRTTVFQSGKGVSPKN